jgi:hypothetical protein
MGTRTTREQTDVRSVHIPLRLPVEDGLRLLRELELPIVELRDSEHCFRVDARGYNVAIYPVDGLIRSVWYDDPIGRESKPNRTRKIKCYLSRYGELKNWRKGFTNGWMDFWYNERDRVGMVYGLHMDVIRFNATDA